MPTPGFVLNYTQTEYEDVVAKLDDPTDEKACAEAWEPYLEARDDTRVFCFHAD